MLNSPSSMRLPHSLWTAAYRSVTPNPWPPNNRDDAEAFVRACIAHGLLSLLFAAEELPEAVASALDSARALERAHLRRTEILLASFKKVAGILEGEPFIALKGCDYAFRLYSMPHLRQMADIDFLVPRERNAAVLERLRQGGLRQKIFGGASRLQSHHETVFDLDGVTVEPHHSFIQRPRHAIDYRAVWDRAVPFEAGSVPALRLSDEDAVLYTALSLAIKGFDVPLIRYLDLYLLLDRGGDLEILVSRAREWRIERAFYSALHQVRVVFPEIDARIQPAMVALLSEREQDFLIARVLPPPFTRTTPSRRQQLWRKFQLMDGYRERIGFVLYHAYASVAGQFMRKE